MTKDVISYKELYELLDQRTGQILEKFEALECRVGVIEIWKERATAYVAIAIGALTIVWTLAFDYVKKALKLDV